jgi:serine protease
LYDDVDPEPLLEELKVNPNVDVAEFAIPSQTDPRISQERTEEKGRQLLTTTPLFVGDQGYMDAAPDGINAEYAWTLSGGRGAGVKIYDVEGAWNQNHEDLLLNVPLVVSGKPEDQDDDRHGTAVLGELVSKSMNGLGMNGVCFGADVGLAPDITVENGLVLHDAIAHCVNDGSAGDVILIEVRITDVCGMGSGFNGPVVWCTIFFEAIQVATANGFIVVVAAGDGNVHSGPPYQGINLDQSGCYNRSDLGTRDSGAIIVGAGESAVSAMPRKRLPGSSFGSRVDAQAWGDDVFTLSYGYLWFDSDDPNNESFFRDLF